VNSGSSHQFFASKKGKQTMKQTLHKLSVFILTLSFSLVFSVSALAADPLPSWNEGSSKSAIIDFVQAVTKAGGKDYVEPAQRIATFDNDGTLWPEYPMYTQVLFAFDRVKKLAP
jgi:hypothetical protein